MTSASKEQELYQLKETLAHLEERSDQLNLRIEQLKKRIERTESDTRKRVIDPFDMKFED
jgi:regulator of replication initiation timing